MSDGEREALMALHTAREYGWPLAVRRHPKALMAAGALKPGELKKAKERIDGRRVGGPGGAGPGKRGSR